MYSRIVYDEIWMKGYLNCLREERSLINELIYSLDAARYYLDINSLPELLAIRNELEQMKGEISKIINTLEEYMQSAASCSHILEKAVLQIEIPTLLK